MKIAFVFDQILPSIDTSTMQFVNTVSALSNNGCECTLFIPASNCDEPPTVQQIKDYYHVDGEFSIELIHSIFPGPRVPEKVLHPLICATLLRKRLKHFDMVYTRNIPAVASCLCARIPVLYDTYRPWPAQYKAMVPVFKSFFASKKFIGMTLHSEYSRQRYIDAGFDPDRLCTAHNGFNAALYEPVLSKKEAREKLGLPVEAKIAVYSGMFDMKKGLDHLIMLAKARPDVTFLFIGANDGGEKTPFEVEAEQLDNCILTGWKRHDELPAYLYASDVVMIPPITPPNNTVLPIKIYSYIASRRAIYAPATSDTSELLEHNRNAWLVTPDNPEAELKGFSELIDNSELLDKLGAAAAEDAKNLTWDARAKTILGFVESRK